MDRTFHYIVTGCKANMKQPGKRRTVGFRPLTCDRSKICLTCNSAKTQGVAVNYDPTPDAKPLAVAFRTDHKGMVHIVDRANSKPVLLRLGKTLALRLKPFRTIHKARLYMRNNGHRVEVAA